MTKEKPLWQRMYGDPVFAEVVRVVGYAGCTYRELLERLGPLEQRYGKTSVQSATYILVCFEAR